MARTHHIDYFKTFIEMGEFSHRTAKTLKQILENFSQEDLPRRMKELHAIEQAADEARHELHKKLVRDFITPLERGDILNLVGQLDDVTDGIEDILLKIYMFNVHSIQPDAIEFIKVIASCCDELVTILQEMRNYKKSKTLQNSIIEVNRLEETGDRLLMESMRRLYQNSENPKEIMAWTEIYTQMEACCDACEHAANLVEEVVMKNI